MPIPFPISVFLWRLRASRFLSRGNPVVLRVCAQSKTSSNGQCKVFGRRLAIQSNDLHAGHAQVEAFDGTDFIKSYSGRIITGFEMRGGSQGPVPSKVMGAEGNPPLALRRSIDKGMAPNRCRPACQFSGDLRRRCACGRYAAGPAVCSVALWQVKALTGSIPASSSALF